ncbi:MAG TPA: HAD family hydrolase [Longimicrobiales bacterium]
MRAREQPDPRSGGQLAVGRPAVFLDRDGTLVVERHYLADPARVELVEGAAAALKELAAAGYALVVVTNQSGIARGLYGEAEYRAVQRRIEELLRREGVELDGVYHCPHHPDYTGPCECRKPAPGLFRRAARELGLDVSRSVCIGDRIKDVLPARELGCAAILVRTGYGEEQARDAPEWVRVERDLAAAAEAILAPDRAPSGGGAARRARGAPGWRPGEG